MGSTIHYQGIRLTTPLIIVVSVVVSNTVANLIHVATTTPIHPESVLKGAPAADINQITCIVVGGCGLLPPFWNARNVWQGG